MTRKIRSLYVEADFKVIGTKNISIAWHTSGLVLHTRYFLWNMSCNLWTTQINHFYLHLNIYFIIEGNGFKFECKSVKISIKVDAWKFCMESVVGEYKSFWSTWSRLLSVVWNLHLKKQQQQQWKHPYLGKTISDSLFLVVRWWNTHAFIWYSFTFLLTSSYLSHG